jgi:predicted nucleic acid-binding protein
MAVPPPWVQVRSAAAIQPIEGLGAGETEALALAQELSATLMIVDDRDARAEAVRRGIRITGTVGVLELAAVRNLLSLPDAIQRLRDTIFQISPQILDEALRRDVQRRSPPPNS